MVLQAASFFVWFVESKEGFKQTFQSPPQIWTPDASSDIKLKIFFCQLFVITRWSANIHECCLFMINATFNQWALSLFICSLTCEQKVYYYLILEVQPLSYFPFQRMNRLGFLNRNFSNVLYSNLERCFSCKKIISSIYPIVLFLFIGLCNPFTLSVTILYPSCCIKISNN